MASNPKVKPSVAGIWIGIILMLLGMGSCVGGPVLGAGEGRKLAVIDPVGAAHDPALGGLAEDLAQPHHRHRPADAGGVVVHCLDVLAAAPYR